MLHFFKRMFMFKTDESNLIAYMTISFIAITLIYDVLYSGAEQMDMLTMVYYNVVTASTVGYGDFSPQTVTGKMLTVIYIPIAISLFAGMLSVLGTIIYNNINKKNRGTKYINKDIDYLIIGGYKDKILNLIDELGKSGMKIALLNDLYEGIPYEYKKKNVSWVKGGYYELTMFNHDRIKSYIVLSDNPTDKLSDIRSNFTLEKLSETIPKGKNVIIETVDKNRYTEDNATKYINVSKASLLAKEALSKNSTTAIEAILDNSQSLNQVNVVLEETKNLKDILSGTGREITDGMSSLIGYFQKGKWEYITEHDLQGEDKVLVKGTKLKYVIDGEIKEKYGRYNRKEKILIVGYDVTRIEGLIKNYRLDSRFKDTEIYCNIEVEDALLYDIKKYDGINGDEAAVNSEFVSFNKVALLANLFDSASDETNFYLWKMLRRQLDVQTQILIEMTNEQNRNMLENKYEDNYNQFITYSNTGLVVQELQDSGFAHFLEDYTDQCIKDINEAIEKYRSEDKLS